MMYKTIAPGAIGHGMTFKDAAETAANRGFEGYWFEIGQDAALPVEATKALLAKTGLRAAGFNLPVNFRGELSAFEEDFCKLKIYARYAAEIGATRCATWISPCSDTYSFEQNYALHRDRLRRCCEVLGDFGITLGLEFISPPKIRKDAKHVFLHSLEPMLKLCADMNVDNAGLLLDAWHWDMAKLTRADFAKFTGKQVALVHINDAPAYIPWEEQEDLMRRLPGETGVLRIAEFFDGLKSIGYDGPVMVEPFVPILAKMPFDKACETVMASINKVWPK